MPDLWTDATGAVPPHLLHNFARRGCHAELSQLLALGTARWPSGGFSPLHAACSNGHAACARVLIAAGAPVEVRDSRGETAFMTAARTGAPECARVLLAAGARADVVNGVGDSPLHAAARGGHAECVTLLLDAGADPRVLNHKEKTAEQCAKGAALIALQIWQPPPPREYVQVLLPDGSTAVASPTASPVCSPDVTPNVTPTPSALGAMLVAARTQIANEARSIARSTSPAALRRERNSPPAARRWVSPLVGSPDM